MGQTNVRNADPSEAACMDPGTALDRMRDLESQLSAARVLIEKAAKVTKTFGYLYSPIGQIHTELRAFLERERKFLGDIADEIVLAVCEIPDRNSPDDQPEMMLVTPDELRRIVVAAFDARKEKP